MVTSTYALLTTQGILRKFGLPQPATIIELNAELQKPNSKLAEVCVIAAKAIKANQQILNAEHLLETAKKTAVDLIKGLPGRQADAPITNAERDLEDIRVALTSSEDSFKPLENEFNTTKASVETQCFDYSQNKSQANQSLKQTVAPELTELNQLAAKANSTAQELRALHYAMEGFGDTYHYQVPEHVPKEFDEAIPAAKGTPSFAAGG